MSQAKILLVIAILIAGFAAVFIWTAKDTLDKQPVSNDDEAVFCTMDAMQCPDGSYVGRVAPNCEFATCPGN